jgi:hypothetical protein
MEAPLCGAPARPGPAKVTAPSPIPRGALRGDPSRQPFSFRAPKRWYVDLSRRCRGCGASFVFFARDQKRWAETLGLRLDAYADRCPACRRAFLRERGPGKALSDSSRALAEAPLHSPAVFSYARAALAHARRFGHGPLDTAIAALTALRRHDPSAVEALHLEALCLEASGRRARAEQAFRRFLAAKDAGARKLRKRVAP